MEEAAVRRPFSVFARMIREGMMKRYAEGGGEAKSHEARISDFLSHRCQRRSLRGRKPVKRPPDLQTPI
jgi:hypothetical protein